MTRQLSNDVIAAIVAGGTSMAEVGRELGISRERVRQICARYGMDTNKRPTLDPLQVMRALRDPANLTLSDVAQSINVSKPGVYRMVQYLGLHPAASRLFRWRRRAYYRRKIIEAIRQFVAVHGDVPSSTDFVNHTVSFGAAQKYFGSWNNAIRAAGFQPHKAGRPPKLKVPT